MKLPILRWLISALLLALCRLQAVPADAISWLYVPGEGTVHSRNLSPEQAATLRKGAPGEGLWYLEAGRSYRIQEPGVMARLRPLSLELHGLGATRPQPATPRDQAGLAALREHTRRMQKLNQALHETIRTLSRQAIARGAATRLPAPASVPQGVLRCPDGHEYQASSGFRFCHRDGKPLRP